MNKIKEWRNDGDFLSWGCFSGSDRLSKRLNNETSRIFIN